MSKNYAVIYCATCMNCKVYRSYLDIKKTAFIKRVNCAEGLWVNGRGKDDSFDYHTLPHRVKYCCKHYNPWGEAKEVRVWMNDLFANLPIIKTVSRV